MNDEQLERLTEEAAMFRERIVREIGRAQAKLASLHAILIASKIFPTLAIDSARGEVSRIDDGFMRLREVVSSLKKLKGES